jgi:predicted ATPase/DNA-binding SARP family transcriptional activator
VEPSGSLGKSLIVALTLARGGWLSVAGLVDELWGDDPPRQAKAALQTLVSRVRAECADGLLRSVNGGYRLVVDPDDTDLGRASRLLDNARESTSTQNHSAAEANATTALKLWHGETGVELAEGPAADLRARAATLRSDLVRVLADCRIRLGRAAEAVTELHPLVAASPLDEELRMLLMRALAASGRPNDAIAVFAEFRERLRDELGTSPSARIVQLNAELLRAGDTKPDGVRIGLRTPPNDLVGRENDLATLGELISTSRLTTILGPGGLGKTRLAQELGWQATTRFPAVIFVELASVRSGDDVTLALASTLGIREASVRERQLGDPGGHLDVRERILSTLGDRETLLIIDNCEHIVDDAASWIADILASTTTVRVLATSRSPLSIGGENVFPLDSLRVDDGPDGLGPAGELFLERARSARPGASLPVDVVARICTRLDGLPLAIELAAARVRSMPVDEIERRLHNRFALLTGGERTAPERHRTLMAVIDWSWNLLDHDEQALLRRLSRFPDGFSATAAQIVGAGNGEADEGDVTNALEGLVNQSLVAVSEDAATGQMRYRMLETVREFGDLALLAAGEDGEVDRAMSSWAEWFSASFWQQLNGADQVRTFRIVASEQDNLVSVLRRAIDDRDADVIVTVFATLSFYWAMRGAHSDVVGFGLPVLAATAHYRPDAAHRDAAIAVYAVIGGSVIYGDRRTGLVALGRLRAAKRLGSSSDIRMDSLANLLLALPDGQKAAELLAEYQGSPNAWLAALCTLIGAQFDENAGFADRAIASSLRAHDIANTIGDVWLQATAATSLTSLYSQSGRFELAISWAERSRQGLDALQANGDLQQLSWVTALNELSSGKAERARPIFVTEDDESLGSDYLDLRSIGWVGLAEIAMIEGRTGDGLDLYRRSIEVFDRHGQMAPWYSIVVAGCISAHVHAGMGGTADAAARTAWVDAIARRTRARLLAIHRPRPKFVDMPVTGAALLGISAWLLWPGREDSSAAASEFGLKLLALSGRLGGRQDIPSLNRARHEDVAIAGYGKDAVEAARASVASLAPRDAADLAYELLGDRELFRPPAR